VTLDALCADLQSCFDPPDTETSAVKASKLVEAQVEEIVMNELEILATEVIQEAQVNLSEISFEIRDEDIGGGSKRRSDEGLTNSREKSIKVEPEPMEAVFLDVEPDDDQEVHVAASAVKVKTEVKEVKRRGKYNKRKETKAEQVKKVVMPKKETEVRMKIPCRNCNQEFSSAPEFNSHTIMCAKNLAKRMSSSSAVRSISQQILSQNSKLTISPSPSLPRTKIMTSTSKPFSITASPKPNTSWNSRPSQARIVRESPKAKPVSSPRFSGSSEVQILEPSITKSLASSIKITHIPDPSTPKSSMQFKGALKDPTSLMKSLPQSTKILFTPSSSSPSAATSPLSNKKPPGPPGPPGPGSKGPPGPPGPSARATLVSKTSFPSRSSQPLGPPGPQQPASQMVCSKCRIILPRAEFDAHIASKHQLTSSKASPLPMLGKSSTFSSSSSTTPPSVRTPPPVKVPASKVVAKPPTPVFKCKKCQENFKTSAQLGGHKCWAECEKCSKTFTTKFKSEKHRLDEHTFKCNKCRHMTDSKENLGAHMDAEHSHFCDKCGSVFDSKPLLANHVVKEHSFKCGYCTKLLDSEEAVQVHEKADHATCDMCEDEFTWVETTHTCYFTKNSVGPRSGRVIVQNMYFPGHTSYFI